ncbi:MAG: hypothetical protein R6V53_06710 [Candidatus Woesearchaeota archaeon]
MAEPFITKDGVYVYDLLDLLEALSSMGDDIFIYHFERGDFPRWVENELDDNLLAEILRLSQNKSQMVRLVKKRIKERGEDRAQAYKNIRKLYSDAVEYASVQAPVEEGEPKATDEEATASMNPVSQSNQITKEPVENDQSKEGFPGKDPEKETSGLAGSSGQVFSGQDEQNIPKDGDSGFAPEKLAASEQESHASEVSGEPQSLPQDEQSSAEEGANASEQGADALWGGDAPGQDAGSPNLSEKGLSGGNPQGTDTPPGQVVSEPEQMAPYDQEADAKAQETDSLQQAGQTSPQQSKQESPAKEESQKPSEQETNASEQGANAPGQSTNASGHETDAPEQSAGLPGQGMNTPGQSVDASGQGTNALGPEKSAPGQGMNTPGQGESTSEAVADGQGTDGNTQDSQDVTQFANISSTTENKPVAGKSLQERLQERLNKRADEPAPKLPDKPPVEASDEIDDTNTKDAADDKSGTLDDTKAAGEMTSDAEADEEVHTEKKVPWGMSSNEIEASEYASSRSGMKSDVSNETVSDKKSDFESSAGVTKTEEDTSKATSDVSIDSARPEVDDPGNDSGKDPEKDAGKTRKDGATVKDDSSDDKYAPGASDAAETQDKAQEYQAQNETQEESYEPAREFDELKPPESPFEKPFFLQKEFIGFVAGLASGLVFGVVISLLLTI